MSDAPSETSTINPATAQETPPTVNPADSPVPQPIESETADTAKKVADQENVQPAAKPAVPAPVAAEKPAADVKTEVKPAATAVAEKPAAPAEPPFNTDLLQSCTARFTYKAWRLYHNNRKDTAFLREKPVRAKIEALSIEGGEEIQKLLTEDGVRELSRVGNVVSFTATFEQIQKVIRHPQTQLLDAVAI
jgi:hypothetical protein